MVVYLNFGYCQASNISCTLGNKIVDHSDVVGDAPNTSSFFYLTPTPGFNILHKDNGKTRRETFKFWDLVLPYIRDLMVGF